MTIEGVPAGLALTADDLAVDLARRQRGYGRGARQSIEQDRAEILAGVRHGLTLGSPILLLVRNRDWENWTEVMQVEPLDAERGRGPADGVGRGQQAVDPGHPRAAGPCRPRGRPQVRLQRRAQRAGARLGARDGRPRRRRRRRAGLPRELGIEAWSFTAEVGGVAVDPANATLSRDEADASPLRCPDPAAEARDDRAHRRGPIGRRHGGRRLRGRGPRPAGRARLVRPLGPPARRGPRRRRS